MTPARDLPALAPGESESKCGELSTHSTQVVLAGTRATVSKLVKVVRQGSLLAEGDDGNTRE